VRALRGCAATLCFAALSAAAAPGHAQAPEQEPSGQFAQATESFERGSKLFMDRRYAEALDVLRKSYSLYPSPNSLLLIARCERELGRLEDAAHHFVETASAADARVTSGESQYQPTVASARREGAAVSARLGTLRVKVRHAPNGTVVATEYGRSLLEPDGSAQLAHRAGTARLRVTTPSGHVVRKNVQVAAQRWTDVEVDLGVEEPRAEAAALPPRRAERREQPDSGAPSWMLPVGSVLTGVGVVGMAGFGYFGMKSRSTYDDLAAKCGPSKCGSSERDEADRGKREQTIANVSLVVGGVALATGVTLIVIGLGNHGSKKTETDGVSLTARGLVF
jgi:hypothetical protein